MDRLREGEGQLSFLVNDAMAVKQHCLDRHPIHSQQSNISNAECFGQHDLITVIIVYTLGENIVPPKK